MQHAKRKASDINLGEVLSSAKTHTDPTLAQYLGVLRKYAEFVDAPPINETGNTVGSEYLTDELFAKYLLSVGEENSFKPHFKKATLAAYNYALQKVGKENIFDFAHKYHNTHQVIKVIILNYRFIYQYLFFYPFFILNAGVDNLLKS
jgi:hypothetical protein